MKWLHISLCSFFWRRSPSRSVTQLSIKSFWLKAPDNIDAAYEDPVQDKLFFFKGIFPNNLGMLKLQSHLQALYPCSEKTHIVICLCLQINKSGLLMASVLSLAIPRLSAALVCHHQWKKLVLLSMTNPQEKHCSSLTKLTIGRSSVAS